MKRLLPFLILVNFFLIAVVGFVGMGHAAERAGGCLAETAGFAGCDAAVPASPLAETSAHLDVFKTFSNATLGDFLVALFLIVAVVAARWGSAHEGAPDLAAALHLWRKSFLEFVAPLLRRLTHWLVLHINSPSFI